MQHIDLVEGLVTWTLRGVESTRGDLKSRTVDRRVPSECLACVWRAAGRDCGRIRQPSQEALAVIHVREVPVVWILL